MGPRSGPPVLVWMQPGRRYLKTSLDDATGSWLGCKDGSPGCDVELGFLPLIPPLPHPHYLPEQVRMDPTVPRLLLAQWFLNLAGIRITWEFLKILPPKPHPC